MKITFLIQNFSRGHGSERVTALVASYLASHGHTVQIVSVCGDNSSFYQIDEKIKLHTLTNLPDIDNKKSFVKVLRRYDRYLNVYRPEIVIDVFAAMSIYSIILRKKYGYKNITWEHYNYFNNMGIYNYSRKFAIWKSNYIVTLTKTDMETYLKNNPGLKGRITYIYNPTPFENEEINIKTKEKIILAVGRLVKLKGYDHLLDIWAMVEPKCNDWKLLIVGEGEERVNLESQIKQFCMNNVYLMGQIKEVNKYYEKASILVSTSDTEGLPMNMIEAQSFGVPIISYDYYTGPKDIISDGIDGIIIDANTQEEKNRKMSEAIIDLINNEDKRTSMMGKAKQSSERFYMDKIGEKWISVIESVQKSFTEKNYFFN